MREMKRDPMLPFVKMVGLGLLVVLFGIWVFKNNLKSTNSAITSSEIVAMKKLHFYDHHNGMVKITDVNGNVLTFIDGEAFAKVLIRNLVRKRISIGIGPEEPFELISRKGGLLSLRDPVSDLHLDVTAFGQSNSEVFTRLINGEES